jgi:hypothetical protein
VRGAGSDGDVADTQADGIVEGGAVGVLAKRAAAALAIALATTARDLMLPRLAPR